MTAAVILDSAEGRKTGKLGRALTIAAAEQIAREALKKMPEAERINFALALMMEAREPDAHVTLRHAANELAGLVIRLEDAAQAREEGS